MFKPTPTNLSRKTLKLEIYIKTSRPPPNINPLTAKLIPGSERVKDTYINKPTNAHGEERQAPLLPK